MILLDTNAVLFLLGGHRRARPLAPHFGKLALSPFTLLELQFLEESGKGRFVGADPVKAARADRRFRLDDAPLVEVVEQTLGLAWTRDPFDRLLCGHALARGWPIATSDANIIESLTPAAVIAL